jgi:hypothetical protein
VESHFLTLNYFCEGQNGVHQHKYTYEHTCIYMVQVVRDDRAAYEIQFEQAQQEAKSKRNAAPASGSSLDDAT